MNITRHNYEEYFILYMDNELDPAGRQMVVEFVELHPDLKEELDLLLQYKLVPDTGIIFTGKKELLKGEEQALVNLSNYEEYLLLYTDNELTAGQKAAVESFAAENLAVKKELDLLQFTRLQPETISFPNKETLYRKEEKVRALPIRWWRAAAAILILGIGLTTALLVNNKPATDTAAAGTTGQKEVSRPAQANSNPEKETGVALLNNPAGTAVKQDAAQTSPVTAPVYIQRNNPVAVKDKNAVNKNDRPAPVQNNEPVFATKNDKPTNNLPQPVNNLNVTGNTPKNVIVYNPAPEEKNATKNELATTVVTNPTVSPSDFTEASMKEGAGGKKNKLRGFFRKVTRTFEKRTHINPTDDDNRLLVGGLAIRLK
ncbi:MAG: hypothetical protein HYZ15_14120 [Sphingobacteriales bacterium]|nr:hypothetical protein [Sphingobacteriales bacterium]